MTTLTPNGAAAIYNADPSSYKSRIAKLKPGDTLNLAAGTYPGMAIKGLHGEAGQWIVITGPASGSVAIIKTSACCNAVEILNSSFVSIENLTIDSGNIDGPFGVSAKDGLNNVTHDIRIQNNRFIGQGGSQQTVGISTKTPTWGWIIRQNHITGAGTGMYLGNSDGTMPFVAGLIEGNIIEDTIGYNLEIKWQRRRPEVAGMPTDQSTTIIRKNVFIKDGRPSPDGDRPNVLLGGFPQVGPGTTDMYEVYGNLFVNNPREALLQVAGRVSVHDNVFVGGNDAAIRLMSQEQPLKVAHLYSNTIYSQSRGIVFASPASVEDAVVGNLIFALTPISGPVRHALDNMTDTLQHAADYVKAPGFDPAVMDFHPMQGKCRGRALDLSPFASESDYALDFDGRPKQSADREMVFRGAYAGEAAGVKPQAKAAEPETVHPGALPRASASALEISHASARRGETSSFLVLFHMPKEAHIVALQWELSTGSEVSIASGDIVIGSAAEEARKTLSCSSRAGNQGAPRIVCLVAGGQTKIVDGPVAVIRYRVDRKAKAESCVVRIENVVGVAADLKTTNLGNATGSLAIR